MSQSGAILLFHSNHLQIFKQIKEFLDNYSMLIRMKWAVVNNLPLCSTDDLGLKVHLLSHIFSLLILFLVFYSNPKHPFLLLQTLLTQTTLLVKTPKLLSFKHLLLAYSSRGLRLWRKMLCIIGLIEPQ
jgi:hypothetical protein